MINVPIDKIVPLTTARDTLSKIVSEVETNAPMYVLTKGGKPSVAIVNINYLEKALGGQLSTDETSEPAQQPSEETTESFATAQENDQPKKITNEKIEDDLPTEPVTPPESDLVGEESTPPLTPMPPAQTSAPLDSSLKEVNPPVQPPPLALPPNPTNQPAQPTQKTSQTPPPPPVFQAEPAPTPPNDPTGPSIPPPTLAATDIMPPDPNSQIALGSMDGIQPKPFIEPAQPQPVTDPNAAINPAQYAGPTDQQTGAGNQNSGELPDMVID